MGDDAETLEKLRERWKGLLEQEGGQIKVEQQVKLTPESAFESSFPEESIARFRGSDNSSSKTTDLQPPTQKSETMWVMIVIIGVIILALFMLWSTRSKSPDSNEQEREFDDSAAKRYNFRKNEEERAVPDVPGDIEIESQESQESQQQRLQPLSPPQPMKEGREADLGKKSRHEQAYGKTQTCLSPKPTTSVEPEIRLSNSNEDPLFQTLKR